MDITKVSLLTFTIESAINKGTKAFLIRVFHFSSLLTLLKRGSKRTGKHKQVFLKLHFELLFGLKILVCQ